MRRSGLSRWPRKIDFSSRTVGVIDLFRKIEDQANRIRMWSRHRELDMVGRDAVVRFMSLRRRFSDVYARVHTVDSSPFVTPLWASFVDEFAERMTPWPSPGFLRDPMVMRTMVVGFRHRWLHDEVRFLEERWGAAVLERAVREDAVGDPQLLRTRYLTSPTTVHAAYHLARWEHAVGGSVPELSSVVEWGGGYGNLAKVVRRIAPSVTYTIIDLPLFTALQWLYLSSVLGEESVNVAVSPVDQHQSAKINLVPVGAAGSMKGQADMFISTWGLSESNEQAIDLVLQGSAFGARNVLLAYTCGANPGSPSLPIERLAAEKRASFEVIEFLPGNKYAFS